MQRLHWLDPEHEERETREAHKRQMQIKKDKRLKPPKAKRKGKAYSASRHGDYLAKPPNEID